MSDLRIRRIAWVLAIAVLVVLAVSVILILYNPTGQDARVWEFLSGAVFGCGAPILGLVILRKQPRNRIGWLWMVIGLTIAFGSLSQGFKYQANSTPSADYSSLTFTILLFSETMYLIRFGCLMLMMLWFPDGKPPTSRWRILHPWLVVSLILLNVELFAQKVPWSGVEGFVGGAPLVNNPIGFIPVIFSPIYQPMPPIGFFSLVVMSLLAALSLFLRYRSARELVRAQIRWFVVGSVAYVASFVVSLVLLEYLTVLPGVLTNLALLPLYMAIGISITRYRLYDIDLIIRKTLQYSLLTGMLAFVYFGSILLLQSIFDSITDQTSQIVIVVSTLLIAAIFNPLRSRIQDFIDRRFYRRKYDSEFTLSTFATVARDEVNLENLSDSLLGVIEDTLHPATSSLWLRGK